VASCQADFAKYTGLDEGGVPEGGGVDGAAIMIHGDGVRDSWDGKIVAINLAQTIAEERIPSIVV